MTNDRRTVITVAIIEGIIAIIVAIITAFIGAKWGKENIEVAVNINGESVILKDADIKEIASENEELKNKLSDYESQIIDLESESESLAEKLGIANGELEDVPVIEYKDCGLYIDGEEKIINKEKSSVLINGSPYYSKEFVDNLLPSDKSAIEKDGMLYVGKIIKEKSNLLDTKMINIENDINIEENVNDTYGNMYNEAIVFTYGNNSITYNTNREYSKLKCTLAVLDEQSGGGIIQIESEKKILYTSKEIISTTEPFEIDIPINQAPSITIKQIGGGWSCIMVADAVLYNEE